MSFLCDVENFKFSFLFLLRNQSEETDEKKLIGDKRNGTDADLCDKVSDNLTSTATTDVLSSNEDAQAKAKGNKKNKKKGKGDELSVSDALKA